MCEQLYDIHNNHDKEQVKQNATCYAEDTNSEMSPTAVGPWVGSRKDKHKRTHEQQGVQKIKPSGFAT